HVSLLLCFVSHDPATPELYPLSLHDALPISWRAWPFPTSTARRCRPIGLIRPAAVLSRQGEGAFVRWTPDGDFVGEEPVRGLLRSEEHTSELQSRENLVCRLLLEKKKKTHKK